MNGAFFASFTPRLPELRDRLGVSTGAIGALLTVAAASGLLASFVVRRTIARSGTRTVLIAGGGAISASLLLVGLARSWPVAAIGLAGMFLFDVFVDVAMNVEGSRLSARRRRPIMSRLHGLWSLGSVAGGLVAARLAEATVSLTAHLCVTAGVLVVVSTALATQLPAHTGRTPDRTGDRTGDARPSPGGEALPPPAGGRPGGSERRRFFVAGLAAVGIETAAISWAAFRISDDLGGSAGVAALAYVAVVGGMTVGRFSGDHLAHRWGGDRVMRISVVAAVAALCAASAVPSAAFGVAAFAVAGVGIAALAPRLYDRAARAGGGTGAGLGVLTAGIRTAIIVVPAAVAATASASSVGLAVAITALPAGAAFLWATGTSRDATGVRAGS